MSILLYIGIAVIIIGWLLLSWFSAGQIKASREYGQMPQRWAEVKHTFVVRRWIARGIIIAGLILVAIAAA